MTLVTSVKMSKIFLHGGATYQARQELWTPKEAISVRGARHKYINTQNPNTQISNRSVKIQNKKQAASRSDQSQQLVPGEPDNHHSARLSVDTHAHKNPYTQIHKYTNTQIHKYINTQNTQIPNRPVQILASPNLLGTMFTFIRTVCLKMYAWNRAKIILYKFSNHIFDWLSFLDSLSANTKPLSSAFDWTCSASWVLRICTFRSFGKR